MSSRTKFLLWRVRTRNRRQEIARQQRLQAMQDARHDLFDNDQDHPEASVNKNHQRNRPSTSAEPSALPTEEESTRAVFTNEHADTSAEPSELPTEGESTRAVFTNELADTSAEPSELPTEGESTRAVYTNEHADTSAEPSELPTEGESTRAVFTNEHADTSAEPSALPTEEESTRAVYTNEHADTSAEPSELPTEGESTRAVFTNEHADTSAEPSALPTEEESTRAVFTNEHADTSAEPSELPTEGESTRAVFTNEHADTSAEPSELPTEGESTSTITRENIQLGNRQCHNLVDYSASEAEDFSADDSGDDPLYQPQNRRPLSDIISDSDEEQPNITPIQTPTRWKKRDPSLWKVNITKTKRADCLPYRNKKKECAPKIPKYVNCTRCRFNCTEKFTEEQRLEICRSYWGFNDNKRQKDFLIKSVKTATPKRRKVDDSSTTARSVSKQYYLENNGGRFRVCANFFQKTLCISNGPITTAIKGKDSTGCFHGIDKRGRKIPGNKTSEEQLALIKQHIESYPCMEAHYVRQSSKKRYLDSTLSVLKMYDMYTELCKEKEVTPVSEFTYRRIFCTSYNMSFYKPKKDLCPTCHKYEVADNDKKKELERAYTKHIFRKNDCNSAKENDKLRCRNDSSFITANFDLQSVLQIPFSDVSQFYYSRKLCVYNLTIYEGDGHNAFCYCWNELNGKRGSNEIGSIILKYLQQLPSTVTEVSLFSDTCGGQNRNQQMAAMLLYAVKTTHLKIIEHKFLESGHSHMECDSMHSAIEHAKKYKNAYVMNDWMQIFKEARSKRSYHKQSKDKKTEAKGPYKVLEMKFTDFMDLQNLASITIRNRKKDNDGNVASWLKIKCLKFDKSFPETMFYRYDHCSQYKQISVSGRGRRRHSITANLNPVYKQLLPIQKKKREDLEKLCNSGLIPEEVHHWYKNLPITTSESAERLPEPDIEEIEEEEKSEDEEEIE